VKVQPSLRIGRNRTGLAGARERHGMLDVPDDLGPTSRGSIDQIASVRNRYARAGGPTGTMPASPRIASELVPLLDLLGARLQFERSGVRLYDALIAKRDAYGGFRGGPTRDDLVHIRDEELSHMRMLDNLITELGGDSTVVTPCANVEATASRGIADVLLDPRTSLLDGLEAVIVAELTDLEQWNGLIDLARELGRDDLLYSFRSAHATEEDHLDKVRAWIVAGRAVAREQVRS
jgi:rubrerythrin